MNPKIFFRPERCMLCFSCALACQLNSLGILDVRKIPRKQRPMQRISVDIRQGTPWPLMCRHCVSAPCVEACITGSLVKPKSQSGIVHHPETCVGCGSCLLVCPFSALTYDEKDEKMTKCNLCSEKEVPPCVRACQSKALVCRPPDVFTSEKKKNFAKEMRRFREAN